MQSVRERVSRLMADQFHVEHDRITEAANLDEDFAATSLDLVEVVMSLEDEFSIVISDGKAAQLHTVGDVLACVTAIVAKQARRDTAAP